MSEQAYSILVDLDVLSKRNSAGLPATEEVQATWSGIGFRMGKNYFVASMDEVSEIIEVPQFTVVPGVKSWVKGIANVRGRLLPIMDLTSFFQTNSKQRETNRRIIVVDKNDMYSGLLIDEILGMQHFLVDNFQKDFVACGELVDTFVAGAYHKDDQAWHLFKLFDLAEDPQFLQAAAT
jgi:twitching motility protein PilI